MEASAAARGLLYGMSRHCFHPIAVLGLSVWLITGCRSVPAGNASEGADQGVRQSARKENSRKAAREAENALRQRAKAHAHYAAGVIHDLNEQPELALAEFTQAAQADPGNENLTLEVSRRLLQTQQPEKALELLQSAAARPHASGMIFARLGFVHAQLGQHAQAVEASRKAVQQMPDALVGYQNLFLGYLQSKQPEAALKTLDEAAQRPATNPDFLMAVAELYANYAMQFPTQRDAVHARGLKVLNRVRELSLPSPQQRLKLGDGFNLFGDTATAAEIYRELLQPEGEFPALHEMVRIKLVDLYLRANDRPRAAELLESILRDDPSNAQAHYQLGRFAYEQERWADAVARFKNVVLFNPNFEQAHYDLAAAQIALGDAGDAIVVLDQARAKFSSNFVVEYLLGVAHNREKNYADAVQHYTAAEVIALATDTNRLNQGFFFQLGAALERHGDREQAARYFEKCLELAPDFHEAMNYLGYMWAEQGENLERARELIARALAAEPDNDAYLDSMAWVLFKLNQPREALEYMLKAVAAAEEPDATLFDHLGDIYAALNEPEQAREAWRKSLAVEANEAVQKKLDSTKVE